MFFSWRKQETGPTKLAGLLRSLKSVFACLFFERFNLQIVEDVQFLRNTFSVETTDCSLLSWHVLAIVFQNSPNTW